MAWRYRVSPNHPALLPSSAAQTRLTGTALHSERLTGQFFPRGPLLVGEQIHEFFVGALAQFLELLGHRGEVRLHLLEVARSEVGPREVARRPKHALHALHGLLVNAFDFLFL